METLQALVDYLNEILANGAESVDQYEDYYRQLSELLYSVDNEFDMEVITDADQGKAEYDEQNNILRIYLNGDNDFHYFIFEVLQDFVNQEEQVGQAYDYFTSLLQNDKIEFIAGEMVKIAGKIELSEEEDKLITGAHEYLWRVVELLGGQDEEEIHEDILYSIKIVNSMLRFADLELEDMEIFELQYDFGSLNMERLKKFLEYSKEHEPESEEARQMFHEAKNIISNFIKEINLFSPDPKILNLSTEQMVLRIVNQEFIEILKWLTYLKNNNMKDEYNAVIKRLVDDQHKALENEEWDEALALSNVLLAVEPTDTYIRMLRIMTLLGLRLFFDAYQDFKLLEEGKIKHNQTYAYIRQKFSKIGLD